jgi:nitrogen-specific signal transduction histidine kinase
MLPAEEPVTTPEPAAPAPPATPVPDLLSSVCHDLKDPLASIVMGAGFLKRAISTEDQASQRVIEAIHRAAERMSSLITSFGDLARLEKHELTLQLRPHDLAPILQAAFEQLTADGAAQKVSVSREGDDPLPTLPCDKERMLQILRHLGACALRVVPEGGSVVVRTSAPAGVPVRIEVVARRRPGPTSRRITAEPPKPGLTIARGLIDLHGGTLIVDRDADALSLSFHLPSGPS